jgi:hypothetical protein
VRRDRRKQTAVGIQLWAGEMSSFPRRKRTRKVRVSEFVVGGAVCARHVTPHLACCFRAGTNPADNLVVLRIISHHIVHPVGRGQSITSGVSKVPRSGVELRESWRPARRIEGRQDGEIRVQDLGVEVSGLRAIEMRLMGVQDPAVVGASGSVRGGRVPHTLGRPRAAVGREQASPSREHRGRAIASAARDGRALFRESRGGCDVRSSLWFW